MDDIFEMLVKPRDLAEWRQEAHKWFDRLWEGTRYSRAQAYAWLAKNMNLPQHEAHIKNMNEFQCKKLIEKVKEVLNEQ